MKKIMFSLMTAIMFAFSISVMAQSPPPPNGGNGTPTPGGNTPVGGGAPVGSGVVLLITLAAGYGAKKVYSSSKRELAE